MRSGTNSVGWLALAAIAATLGVGMSAVAADAAGTWKWTIERNGNAIETVLKLTQEGSQLTGTLTRMGTETAIEDGKFTDDNVSFKVSREINGNKFVIAYEGKLSGDNIKGTVKFGDSGSRDWEAKRSP